jgi:hypothetical protein
MFRKIIAASFALALVASSTVPAIAATQCRDAKGKFVKCPPKKPVQCRDKKGKFVKCPAPPAKPAKPAKY